MLQLIFNRLFELDPGLQKYLQELEGTNVEVICRDWPQQNRYFTFTHNRILFNSNIPQTIDVTISATLQDFVRYAIFKQKENLSITGDATIAGTLEKLYLNMNIDWEEELSKHTGDVFAYQACKLFKTLKDYTVNSSNLFGEMISEYLQEESGILPTAYEVEEFMQEVDDLRLRVDRLEARIKAYENR